MEKKLLTAKQVQELLHVDRTTIYRMLKDGRLTGIKVGQRWRFSEQEVDDLLSGAIRLGDENQAVSVDALPLHCMQPVQDVFAEIAEVGSVTAGVDGRPLTRVSNSCDFCKLIMGSEDGRQACIESWRMLTRQTNQAPEFISCHAGLQYARARIEVGGEIPCNTSGGMLSESYMQSWNHQPELVRQLRHAYEGTERQVNGAEVGQYVHDVAGKCLSVVYTRGDR